MERQTWNFAIRHGRNQTCDAGHYEDDLWSRRGGTALLFNDGMKPPGIAQIALELCDLLQQQLDSITGRKLTDFTPEEMDTYEKRKSRIEELRRKLHRLASAGPRTAIRRVKPASGCRAAR